VNYQHLVFSSHAIQQMFFRRISKEEVKTVINNEEMIEQRLDDTPFPSYLILDFIKGNLFMLFFLMMKTQRQGMW
jgi:hypothetical protein